jgi:hypothetical protein
MFSITVGVIKDIAKLDKPEDKGFPFIIAYRILKERSLRGKFSNRLTESGVLRSSKARRRDWKYQLIPEQTKALVRLMKLKGTLEV